MSSLRPAFVILTSIALFLLIQAGCDGVAAPEEENTRIEAIPADAVKRTPETDAFPPVLHSNDYEQPVPVAGPINTAGAEGSPFIPARSDELYFFFTPDVRVPPEKQILDGVTGIYRSRKTAGVWQEPERIRLQDSGKLSLDGCAFVLGNVMLFCSARERFTGIHWFSASYQDSNWSAWEVSDFNASFDVGELHIHGNELYYHSSRDDGLGDSDIWMLQRIEGTWADPMNVAVVNTPEFEGFPFISPDGNELWFNRWYEGSPAIYRSMSVDNEWQEPQLILSSFAGAPTLDKDGNVYFVHHFYEDGVMIEVDIYFAFRK